MVTSHSCHSVAPLRVMEKVPELEKRWDTYETHVPDLTGGNLPVEKETYQLCTNLGAKLDDIKIPVTVYTLSLSLWNPLEVMHSDECRSIQEMENFEFTNRNIEVVPHRLPLPMYAGTPFPAWYKQGREYDKVSLQFQHFFDFEAVPHWTIQYEDDVTDPKILNSPLPALTEDLITDDGDPRSLVLIFDTNRLKELKMATAHTVYQITEGILRSLCYTLAKHARDWKAMYRQAAGIGGCVGEKKRKLK